MNVGQHVRRKGLDAGSLGGRAGGQVRHLCALAGREIEHDDLHRLLLPRFRSAVREGDPPAVRAEGYRRGKATIGVAKAPLAARGAEATQSGAVRADEEEPLLLGR